MHIKLFGVINQLNVLDGFGWKQKTSAELDPEIRVWYWQLRKSQIPLDAYQEVVDRMTSNRARAIGRGDKPIAMDVYNFIATWRVIREERLQRQVDERRSLPVTAASDCPRCLGTNVEDVFSADGRKLGARPGCQHDPVSETETWLYRQIQEGKR